MLTKIEAIAVLGCMLLLIVLPSLREQARILDEWKDARIRNIPNLLGKYGVDGWLMSQREHAEDVIWWSIKNATDFDAHRRTIILFHNKRSEKLPSPIKWVDNTGSAWPELTTTLETLQIDINFASGLQVGELNALQENIFGSWDGQLLNVPMLGIEYVATRVDGMLEYYHDLQEIVWATLERAFLTNTDLQWWFREKMQALNVTTWNQPRISVVVPESFPGWEGTDDHMAYILCTSEGEKDVPEGLKEGDIVLDYMHLGLTGNEVLTKSLERMKVENISGQIFCHPIGDWGHDAGAAIGITNLPEHVPVLGDLPVLPNTFYGIELYAYHFVAEGNETLRFRLEENAHRSEEAGKWRFVRGRQERLHIIDPTKRRRHTARPLLIQIQ
ncbi:hypothetical protein BDN71DRAFT_1481009 [Pleurotus eryngii]|uniref:Peptidase M24 domain-containing protein n=1 Tax=Pleurotus eryngii TaxID=5323 RepID=A0A9P6A253_PLEER|nr:hypothetical protein BDN71DRAFT_1481009 [Pleurotus eryngii]